MHRDWYKRFLEECPEGVLRKPDMVAMYSQILPQEDPSVIIEHLFRIFDRDGDGTIDFKEFVLATEITTSGQPEEKLRWTFKVQLSIKERGLECRKHFREVFVSSKVLGNKLRSL